AVVHDRHLFSNYGTRSASGVPRIPKAHLRAFSGLVAYVSSFLLLCRHNSGSFLFVARRIRTVSRHNSRERGLAAPDGNRQRRYFVGFSPRQLRSITRARRDAAKVSAEGVNGHGTQPEYQQIFRRAEPRYRWDCNPTRPTRY